MADILVRHKGKFRMWNTVVDCWNGPLMGELDMAKYLIEEYQHAFIDAYNRILRISTDKNTYDKKHLAWLKKYFDSQYNRLCALDRRNRKRTNTTDSLKTLIKRHAPKRRK